MWEKKVEDKKKKLWRSFAKLAAYMKLHINPYKEQLVMYLHDVGEQVR